MFEEPRKGEGGRPSKQGGRPSKQGDMPSSTRPPMQQATGSPALGGLGRDNKRKSEGGGDSPSKRRRLTLHEPSPQHPIRLDVVQEGEATCTSFGISREQTAKVVCDM